MANLTAKIKLEGIEKIRKISNLLLDQSKDERIPLHVREDYMDKVNEILEK
jgi:hypothetical protein